MSAPAACADLGESESGGLYIMSQYHSIETERMEGSAGLTCAEVSGGTLGGSSLGSATDDFWMEEKISPAGLSVTIGSHDDVLERSLYGREFIMSRVVDRFVVTTRGGASYAFTYWGGVRCESCPPGELEAFPGDPWGCAPSTVGLSEPQSSERRRRVARSSRSGRPGLISLE